MAEASDANKKITIVIFRDLVICDNIPPNKFPTDMPIYVYKTAVPAFNTSLAPIALPNSGDKVTSIPITYHAGAAIKIQYKSITNELCVEIIFKFLHPSWHMFSGFH